jgi:HEAT repeat protein
MKRLFSLALFVVALLLAQGAALGADAQDQQIAILQSSQSLAEKDAACARLKWIGTAHCVPALAALLTDESLSHSARYALESMPGPEAERALLQALAKTSGSNQIGIINSLAVRRDTAAADILGKLLSNADTRVASAAAMALGRISGPQALNALRTAWDASASGPLHDAEADGLLACANDLLTAGRDSVSLGVFQKLYDTAKTDRVRQAAFCGVILASGREGVALMAKAIAGHDSASQAAALQVAAELEGRPVTRGLTDLLPNVNVPVQIALLECLHRRGDPFGLPGVAQMAKSTDADVRLAAIKALGDLGNGSVAAMLAEMAASAAGVEKSAARQALLDLRRGEVTPAILEALTNAAPAVKAELIRALGGRGDKSAVPRLLELARSPNDSLRSSAFQALALLAVPAQLPDLVQLVVQATAEDARSEAADTLNSVCQRIEAQSGHCDTEALVKAVRTAPPEARLALLPICSGLAEAPVREALRACIEDSELRVREAAVRALCDTHDGELLPDLLKAYKGSYVRQKGDINAKLELLAFRGYVRLLTQEESAKLSNEQKVAALRTLLERLERPLNADQKRLVLSGLSSIPDAKALALTSLMLDDPSVKAEAAQAVIRIANSLPPGQAEEAEVALAKVLAVNTDPATSSSAEEARKKVSRMAGYVTLWQVAGPYEQQGKNFSDLFDIPFAPESGDSRSVDWKSLPASANPAESWKMDLLQALGGQQRAAYARTWINSPKQQKVRLELGSDDGVKVWLNGLVIYSNNVSRALQPGSDIADITLNEGWNTLMLKVTQNTAGWEFCVRFAQASGEPVTGLRVALNPDISGR